MTAKAAPPHFPYLDHRSMAEVMEEEERQRAKWRKRYDENFRSVKHDRR